MDISIYFKSKIDQFITNITTSSNLNVDTKYNLIIGSYRCLGRLRDYKKYDVNKRCKNMAQVNNNLCKRCMKNCRYGLVTEKLKDDISLYKTYKKKHPEFEREYDNNIKLFCEYSVDDFKEMMRKIDKRNSKKNNIISPQLDVETVYNNLPDYIDNDDIKSINIDDIEALDDIVMKKKKEIISKLDLHLTMAESEEFYNKLQSYIKNHFTNVSISIEDADMIILKDLNTHVDLYMIKKDDKITPYHLYFKSKSGYLLVGYARNWIDTNDEVPEQHKNYENIVLDDTQLPVLEVEINDTGSLITGIPKGIYREWEYDEDMEQFRITSYIERIE
jgi:hypothetical protein